MHLKLGTAEEYLNQVAQLDINSIELGLTRIQTVLNRLELLPFKIPVITVAGTNGKGSCVAVIEALLMQRGYRVGCYTSPHVLNFNERIRVQQQDIPDQDCLAIFKSIENKRQDTELTYFEWATIAALMYFQQQACDVVVLEVGLGGRLDAVNAVDADIAVITQIDLDHMDWLGDTREAIALEKAGIFRENQTAFCADSHPPQSLLKRAKELSVDLKLIHRDFDCLAYNHHLLSENINTAVGAAKCFSKHIFTSNEIQQALQHVKIIGRQQVLSINPWVIIDCAHNPASSQRLAQRVRQQSINGTRIALVGVMADKDLTGLLAPMLPAIDKWVVTELVQPRAASSMAIKNCLEELSAQNIECVTSAEQAYRAITANMKSEDGLIVFGSFYTVSEILRS